MKACTPAGMRQIRHLFALPKGLTKMRSLYNSQASTPGMFFLTDPDLSIIMKEGPTAPGRPHEDDPTEQSDTNSTQNHCKRVLCDPESQNDFQDSLNQ